MKAFFTILGLVALLIGLAARGYISPNTAGLLLFGLVILLAIGRATKTGLMGTIFGVGIPILSIMALAFRHADSQCAAIHLIGQLFLLALALFGIYLIVSSPFRRK